MTGLKDIVRQEVDQYAGESLNATLHPVFDEVRQVYTVISIGQQPEVNAARAVVMAQVIGEYAIILADTTDKPLVNALLQAGTPREKVILAYAGEPLPEET